MEIGFESLGVPANGAVVIGVTQDRTLLEHGQALDESLGGLLTAAMANSRFTGNEHQTLTVASARGQVVLYGLGDGSKIDAMWCERAGGTIFGELSMSGAEQVTVIFEPHGDDASGIAARAAHLGQGALLKSYRFDKYKTKLEDKDKPSLAKMTIATPEADEATSTFDDLSHVAAGVFLARDLVNEPPITLTPVEFARRCEALGAYGLEVTVLDEPAMEALGMWTLLGVGRGSVAESRLVVMEWKGGAEGEKPLAFVGKGVCFDTGGISLKPAGGMDLMKMDMGGAAVVTGLMRALAGRKAPMNAIGVIGCVVNMPDGDAQVPSDIVTSMSGQTVEILNTDAEGRLVLADALWYTQDKYDPAFMIDLATLTGAMMVALGKSTCGFFSNDDTLSDKLTDAGTAVGERAWRMPLGADYDKLIESDFADMKNVGPREGGAITAACFLQRFVNDKTWAHMDIAGVAWEDKGKPTVTKGGSGWGVRLLDQLVRDGWDAS